MREMITFECTKCKSRNYTSTKNKKTTTQRLEFKVKDDEEALRSEIIKLAGKYGRYGYRPDHGPFAA